MVRGGGRGERVREGGGEGGGREVERGRKIHLSI